MATSVRSHPVLMRGRRQGEWRGNVNAVRSRGFAPRGSDADLTPRAMGAVVNVQLRLVPAVFSGSEGIGPEPAIREPSRFFARVPISL